MRTIHHYHSRCLSMDSPVYRARKAVGYLRLLPRALCAILLLTMISMGDAVHLHGQCDGDVRDLCNDSCCYTDAILLNSGYDHDTRSLYKDGARDNYWQIVDGEVTEDVLPTRSNVPIPNPEWDAPFPNSNWIDANIPTMDPGSAVKYRKCFCVCSTQTLTFTLQIGSFSGGYLLLDGDIVEEFDGGVVEVMFTEIVGHGRHCLEIELHSGEHPYAPLNVAGSIQGPGLLNPTCCSTPPIELSGCQTDRLQLKTDNTWTIVSGPAAAGPFPRNASSVTTPAPWPPNFDPNWIAPNNSGTSLWNGGIDTYVYRKTFCVDKTGTFIITVTSRVDDGGDIFLNGVLLGPATNWSAPGTQTFIVALESGCNCLDIYVYDLATCCTGLNATIDIEGGILLDQACCEATGCDAVDGEGRPGIDNDNGGDHLSGMHHNAAGNNPIARPMLVSLPNPVTGESAVHYVLDREADARVELYNSAGQRVMVLDEGARKSGEHVVNMNTKELSAGAYQLVLVYGDRTLSVPVTVR